MFRPVGHPSACTLRCTPVQHQRNRLSRPGLQQLPCPRLPQCLGVGAKPARSDDHVSHGVVGCFGWTSWSCCRGSSTTLCGALELYLRFEVPGPSERSVYTTCTVRAAYFVVWTPTRSWAAGRPVPVRCYSAATTAAGIGSAVAVTTVQCSKPAPARISSSVASSLHGDIKLPTAPYADIF